MAGFGISSVELLGYTATVLVTILLTAFVVVMFLWLSFQSYVCESKVRHLKKWLAWR